MYGLQAKPIFVNTVLGPLFALFVCFEVVPSVPAAVVDKQAPLGIVSKGLFGRLCDVDGGEHGSKRQLL